MGTRLALTGMNWDPDSGRGLGFAQDWGFASLEKKRIALSTATSASVVMDATKDKGVTSVASGFYKKFLKVIANHKFASAVTPVYTLGYDWRISIEDSAAAVRRRIKRIMKDEDAKCAVVISHSMGGLVSRAMFKQYSDVQASVAGVIHVVQPAVGAVALYRRLFTGMKKDLDGGGVRGWVLNSALGQLPSEFATLISVLPGAMQLCASANYSRKDGWLQVERGETASALQDALVFGSYASGKSPPGVYSEDLHHSDTTKARLSSVVAQAKKVHEWLKVYKLEGKTWAIYSTGVHTDVAIAFRKLAPATPSPWLYWADGLAVVPGRHLEGDGTVPENSSSLLFPGQAHDLTVENTGDAAKRQFRVTGVEHAEAFNNDDVSEGVIQLVQQAINAAAAELIPGR